MRATNKKLWLTSQIHQQILDGKYEIRQGLSAGDTPRWYFSTEFYGHVPELRQDYIDSTVHTYETLEDLDLSTLYPKTFVAARNNIHDEVLEAMQEYCKTDVETTEQLYKNMEEKGMSLIITKHGDLNTTREFKCRNCGCEFIATNGHYDNTKDNLNTLITVCPECNIYVSAAIPTTYLRGRRAVMKPVDELEETFEDKNF